MFWLQYYVNTLDFILWRNVTRENSWFIAVPLTVRQTFPDLPDFEQFLIYFPEFLVKTPDNSWFLTFYP